MGPDAMILVSWMLSFKPTFSLFLFPFHQEALQFLFASIWPLTFTDSEQFFPKCGIKITGWLLKRTWFAEQIYWIISRKGMWTSFIIYVLKKFWSHCGGMWNLSSPTRDQTHTLCIRSTKSLTPELPRKSLNLLVFFCCCCCFAFSKKFIYFNWRIITLQRCGAFCHTSTWISHGYTWCPHPETPPTSLPTPSLLVVPEHQLSVPCFMHWTCTGPLFYI